MKPQRALTYPTDPFILIYSDHCHSDLETHSTDIFETRAQTLSAKFALHFGLTIINHCIVSDIHPKHNSYLARHLSDFNAVERSLDRIQCQRPLLPIASPDKDELVAEI